MIAELYIHKQLHIIRIIMVIHKVSYHVLGKTFAKVSQTQTGCCLLSWETLECLAGYALK